jgi:branched-chain amino acid transport system substrate-binding protein
VITLPSRRRAIAMFGAASLAAPSRAQTSEPIHLGLLLAATGPLARASNDLALGLALALDQADRKVAGRAIQVTIEDTQSQPARAVERFTKLFRQDQADVVIGPMASPELLALRDVVHDAGLPLIVPNAGVTAIAQERCSPFIIRVSYSNDQIGASLARWIAARGEVKTAYLLGADNLGARDHLQAFRKNFEAAGGRIVGEEFVPAGERDLAPYLGKIRLFPADAIFASFFGNSAQRFLDAFRQSSIGTMRLFGPSWLVTTLDPQVSGARVAGIVGATIYSPELDLPSNRDFVAAFTARHARPPSEFAAQGYDAGRLLIAALEVLGGTTTNRRALAAVLASTPFIGARGALAIDPKSFTVVQDVHVFEARKQPGGEGVELEIIDRIADVVPDSEGCKP